MILCLQLQENEGVLVLVELAALVVVGEGALLLQTKDHG